MKTALMGCLSVLAALAPTMALSVDFLPDDRVVSDPTKSLPQPEFDEVGQRMVWQDRFGRLWIADVAADTGAILPADGKGLQIDSGVAPAPLVGNTPRFTYGGGDSILVYTKQVGDVLHLAAAREDGVGGWITELLVNGEDRYRANGSPTENPDVPRIVYNRETASGGVISWRDVDDPASEGTVNVEGSEGGRFLGGERKLLVLNVIDGFNQVMEVDLETGAAQQITFGNKNTLNPFIWWAPEFQDLAFVAMVNFRQLAIYRRIAGVWTQVHVMELPSDKPLLSSPEAIVSHGRSYVTAVAADELGSGATFPGQPVGPSEIWLAGIDPDQPFFRRIDDPTTAAQRSEPEPYFLTSGPVVYYSELDAATNVQLLRLAQTGLAADYAYGTPAYGGPWGVMHRDGRNSASVPFTLAEQYVEGNAVALPNRQNVRGVLGPDGTLYLTAATNSGKALVAIDTRTGQERYRISETVTGSMLNAVNVLIDARGQYYVPAESLLSKFDANGTLLWQIPSRGLARSAQFAPDGNLLLFTWNGWSHVVKPDDGTMLSEQFQTSMRTFPPEPTCLTGGPANECAYVNAPAVDPGANRVYTTLNRANGNTTVQAFTYDRTTHQLTSLWQQASPQLTGVSSSPVLSADFARLYVQDGAGNLVAIDTATGTIAWTFPLGFQSPQTPPVVSAGGYIMPGGTAADAPGYQAIGIVRDLGGSAEWAVRDSGFRPASAAAAGANDRFVLATRRASDNKPALVVFDPLLGVVSQTPWTKAQPFPANDTAIRGLTVREDGSVFVQSSGKVGATVFTPAP